MPPETAVTVGPGTRYHRLYTFRLASLYESASKKTSELAIFAVFLRAYLFFCISEAATHPEQSIDIDGARKKVSNFFEH